MRGVIASALLALIGFSIPALAHHSYIRIDRSIVIAFEATVLDFQWRNPHVYIRIETQDEAGGRVEGPAGRRDGFRRTRLSPRPQVSGADCPGVRATRIPRRGRTNYD